MFGLLALGFWAAMRGSDVQRLVGVQFCATIFASALVVMALSQARPDFMDLVIAVALLSAGSALTYAHFIGKWL